MIKFFEEYKKLSDIPMSRISVDRKYYRYEIGEIVKFIKLNRIYQIKQINKLSETQDYYIINPYNDNDRGWCMEEELKLPTKKDIEKLETFYASKKYNL